MIQANKEPFMKTRWLIIAEWFSTIGVFIICFVYLANKIDGQMGRTDRLYELYVEANKNLSDYRKEADAKFYDLLREYKEEKS